MRRVPLPWERKGTSPRVNGVAILQIPEQFSDEG